MKIVYGIFTFVVGLILMVISGGIFSSDGPVQVTNSTFNSGMMGLCVAIILAVKLQIKLMEILQEQPQNQQPIGG